MRAHRVGVVALSVGLVLALPAGAAPAAEAAPAAGRVDERGRVIIDLTVDRFALERGRVVAKATALARLTSTNGVARQVRRRVTLRVQRGAQRCQVLTLTLATLRLDLLGLRVRTSPVNLTIRGLRRGGGAGVLGRLFCNLADSTVRLGGGRGRAAERAVVRSLNREVRGRPVRAFRVDSAVAPRQAPDSPGRECDVLDLVLGPLDLNLLGLVVELYGQKRDDPVQVTITALPTRGVLGRLFCGVAGADVAAPRLPVGFAAGSAPL